MIALADADIPTNVIHNERGRQLRRPYFREMRPRSRTSALYRSIWPASLDQLEERFLRTSASSLLCANFTRRRHSAAWSLQCCALSIASMAPSCSSHERQYPWKYPEVPAKRNIIA
jgi:hypothetical protein